MSQFIVNLGVLFSLGLKKVLFIWQLKKCSFLFLNMLNGGWYSWASIKTCWGGILSLARCGSGTHFTNDFSITIQIRRKFHLDLILITDDQIATKFGTCHGSPAVVPCAKSCSDHFISIWMRAKWNFHHISIVIDKLLVKWAPVSWCCMSIHFNSNILISVHDKCKY